MLSLYTLSLIGLALSFSHLVVQALACPVRTLPGPWYSRFTGLVLKYHIALGRRMHYVHTLHDKYGPIVRIAPREVAIADVQAAQAIHKVGSGFTKSAWYEELTRKTRPDAVGDSGIFLMRDPKEHAARRRLFARPFSNSALQANSEDAVREKVNLAVKKIREEYEWNGEADVMKWWTLMTTDVIAHLSFGESFGGLQQGKQTPFIDALQSAIMAGILFSEIPPLHWLAPYLPFKSIKRLLTAENILLEHGGLAYRNMRTAAANTQNLFGQMLAQADSSEKAALTENTVRTEAANFILAGSDTTAVTLTYLTWAVLKQPELRRALEAEVSSLSDDLTQEELRDAPLLNSVIEEALRLYGAAPGALPRDVPSSGATLCGRYIPPGVVVTTQAYTLHRLPDVFPNPSEFDGWRFIKQPMTLEQKAAYMPFGGGTRVCLGIHLAMMELRLATAAFFRQNRGMGVSPETTEEKMEMTQYFLVAPIGHCCKIVGPLIKTKS
ncbi:hypothetical protein N0V93_007832 [Gnomoniopsis smithogilvyi]|uniref:Cytochrome P450 n=1 Tax=Gnomoniopsis smithogilvyi TaxID=1191159 RepID=A0A9W9CU61_9PEZI|nr:hypothetical protein N0V93_007832 [Gnomoniopsis smithogilvyi]